MLMLNRTLSTANSMSLLCKNIESLCISNTLKSKRMLSTGKGNSNRDQTENFILSEDQPPIPPNYGYRGDENVKNLFELKRIRTSFKYG